MMGLGAPVTPGGIPYPRPSPGVRNHIVCVCEQHACDYEPNFIRDQEIQRYPASVGGIIRLPRVRHRHQILGVIDFGVLSAAENTSEYLVSFASSVLSSVS